MLKNPLLLIALALTGLVALWGIIDTAGLAGFSALLSNVLFTSRSWFIMLSVSLLLILSIWLVFSPYGKIKLGKDDDEPEFSTISWLEIKTASFRCARIPMIVGSSPRYHHPSSLPD